MDDTAVATLLKLKKGEDGERVNLKSAYTWMLREMSYKDFSEFARLHFRETRRNYSFSYIYRVDEKHDSPSAREDYLKYLLYKLIQNLSTPNIALEMI